MPVIRKIICLLFLPLLLLQQAQAQLSYRQALRKLKKNLVRHTPEAGVEDTVLNRIRQSAVCIAGYAEYNNTWGAGRITYHLISFRKEACTAYVYIRAADHKQPEIDSLVLPAVVAAPLLRQLWIAKPWEIRHTENSDEDNCSHIPPEQFKGCTIHDASSKALLLLTASHQGGASYYAPEYYEHTCCPGNPGRQRFLQVLELIFNAFAKTKPGQ